MIIKEITVSYYTENNREECSDFLFNISNSNIFQTIEWTQLLHTLFNFRSYYMIARYNNDKICGILPLFYIKNMNGSRLESLPFTPYGGIIGDNSCIKPIIQKVLELKKTLNCNHILIKQYPINTNVENLLKEKGLKKDYARLTQYLILKEIKILWNEIKSSNRRAIKKARENEVLVKIVDLKSNIKEIYSLELILAKHLHIEPFPIQFYNNISKELGQYFKTFIAIHNRHPVAFAIFFNYKDRVTFFHGVNSDNGRRVCANNSLFWEAMEWSYRMGYKIFDFGPTFLDNNGDIPEKNLGLYSFKQSYNTSAIPISWYHNYNSIKNIDHLQYPNNLIKIGGKLLQSLPQFILQRISLYLTKATL